MRDAWGDVLLLPSLQGQSQWDDVWCLERWRGKVKMKSGAWRAASPEAIGLNT